LNANKPPRLVPLNRPLLVLTSIAFAALPSVPACGPPAVALSAPNVSPAVAAKAAMPAFFTKLRRSIEISSVCWSYFRSIEICLVNCGDDKPMVVIDLGDIRIPMVRNDVCSNTYVEVTILERGVAISGRS